MLEPSGGFDLAEKPLRAECSREIRPQDLYCDLAMVPQVVGEIDGRHPPAAELTLDRVAVDEGSLQSGEEIGHGLPGRLGSPSS